MITKFEYTGRFSMLPPKNDKNRRNVMRQTATAASVVPNDLEGTGQNDGGSKSNKRPTSWKEAFEGYDKQKAPDNIASKSKKQKTKNCTPARDRWLLTLSAQRLVQVSLTNLNHKSSYLKTIESTGSQSARGITCSVCDDNRARNG
jgi:hypothetical protein